MKHHTDIQELLDRYWEGETTLEEERRLRAFFTAGPVPEQFRQEAALFLALRAERSVELPDRKSVPLQRSTSRYRWAVAASIALLFTAGAGWWWLTHTGPSGIPPAQVVTAQPPNSIQTPAPLPELTDTFPKQDIVQVKKTRVKKLRKPRPLRPIQPTAPEAAEEDAGQALAEIKAALELISSKLNKGKKELGKGLHEVETLDKIIKTKSDG